MFVLYELQSGFWQCLKYSPAERAPKQILQTNSVRVHILLQYHIISYTQLCVYIFCCSIIIRSQGLDNCRECPILPRHHPRVFPDLVIGGEITERSANRTARRRRSRQGLHLHVGMSAYHAHRGHGLGGTQCMHPLVACRRGLGCLLQSCPLAPAFPSFFHLSISSSPAPWNSSLIWAAREAAFKKSVHLLLPPCYLFNSSTLAQTSETR